MIDNSEPETDEVVVDSLVAYKRFGFARAASLLVGLVMAGLVAVIVVSMGRPGTTAPSSAIGKIVPELIGTTLDGEPFDIDGLRG